jgi:hypothetical protein
MGTGATNYQLYHTGGAKSDKSITISIVIYLLKVIYLLWGHTDGGDADHAETVTTLWMGMKGDANVAAGGRTAPTAVPTTRPRRRRTTTR